jgi:hypothetical protein
VFFWAIRGELIAEGLSASSGISWCISPMLADVPGARCVRMSIACDLCPVRLLIHADVDGASW